MSNVTLTYYGHATFALSNGEVTLVCDPFLQVILGMWQRQRIYSANTFLCLMVMMIIMVIPI